MNIQSISTNPILNNLNIGINNTEERNSAGFSTILSDAISKCMEIISDLTNYTSVVLGKNSSENTLKQVSIIPLDNNKVVALVCTDKGMVENKQFMLPPNTEVKEVVKSDEVKLLEEIRDLMKKKKN